MIIDNNDLTALLLSLKLALISTIILLVFGTPLAWYLSRSKSRFKFIIESIIAMPLVLPPTVLGFYVLLAMGPNGPIGILTDALDFGSMAFTFEGLVVGSVIYSMPFVVQPLQNSFSSVDESYLETASTLGASSIDRFFTIVIPLSRSGFITALILGFAHTLGEFGIVLMIGGNIPNETQVVSIAIYEHVELMQYQQANLLSVYLLIISFLLLVILHFVNKHLSYTKNEY